jgi:hypothetical protein
MANEPIRPLLSRAEARILAAVQQVLFPPESGVIVTDLAPRFDWMFADAKTAVRTGVRLLLWAVEFSPLVSRFSRFSRLGHEDRVRWFHALLASSKPGIRGLAAVMRVLVQTTTYDNPEVLGQMLTKKAETQ